ncbi:MAG: hypothetical protein U0M13_07375 [Desulfovibrio fairfieldensis]|nr:hypothetical protein [Desulfovibrio fairfieldensis]
MGGGADRAEKEYFRAPIFCTPGGSAPPPDRAGTVMLYNIIHIIMQLLMLPEKAPTFQSENRDHTGSNPPEFCSLPPIDSIENCKRERVRNPGSTRLKMPGHLQARLIYLWISNQIKK